MAISVAGGDQQDQAALQVILNYVEFGTNPEEAFKAPRFSTEHFISSFSQDSAHLGSLSVPTNLPEEVKADPRARGHVVLGTLGGPDAAAFNINNRAKSQVGLTQTISRMPPQGSRRSILFFGKAAG
jgi:gamma-glutamyltranspeptidase